MDKIKRKEEEKRIEYLIAEEEEEEKRIKRIQDEEKSLKKEAQKKQEEYQKNLKKLRKWETSNDIISIYKDIARNRKLILQKIRDTAFGPNNTIIHEDNLIKVLKDFYPYFKLTNTQWKMIVEIGDKDTQGFINFDTFIKLVENCARREEMPRMK